MYREPIEGSQRDSKERKAERIIKNQQKRREQVSSEDAKTTAMRQIAMGAQETAQVAVKLLRDFLTDRLRANHVSYDKAEFVIITHDPEFELRQEIGEGLGKLLGKPILLVPTGHTVGMLDETILAAHGWVRKPKLFDANGTPVSE